MRDRCETAGGAGGANDRLSLSEREGEKEVRRYCRNLEKIVLCLRYSWYNRFPVSISTNTQPSWNMSLAGDSVCEKMFSGGWSRSLS